MPNLDGTGPMGKGAMTGRGFGKCNRVFTSRPGQIRHESGGPHTDRCRMSRPPANDVFIRQKQGKG